MTGRPGCPACGGSGIVLDPDPLVPARPCACVREAVGLQAVSGLPARYREATFEGFWDWWKVQHPKEQLSAALAQACQLMEHPAGRETLPEDLRSKLDLILHKCGARLQGGEVAWKDLKPAQEPQGYRSLFTWARHDRDAVDLWWIDGPPGSGRSSLAAAALKAWCTREGKGGLFVPARTFSQELKDVYYDVRSFRDLDFRSERDRMAPLLAAPCLVLDDLDRVDPDLRVLRAVAQLLDHRYAERLPTLVTASRWVENLATEQFPLLRLEDPNLHRRLAQSRRVALRPTLARLLESVQG